jgi:hypothetical protein
MEKGKILLILIPFICLNLFVAFVTSREYMRWTIGGNMKLKAIFLRKQMPSNHDVDWVVERLRPFAVILGYIASNVATLATILANWNK